MRPRLKAGRRTTEDVTSHLISFSLAFNRFTDVLTVVLWPEEGDFPENLHHDIYVVINKRSFESFMCLDLTELSRLNYTSD